MFNKSAALATLAIVVAVAVAGCGSSSEAGSEQARAVEQVQDVCVDTKTELGKVGQGVKDLKGFAKAADGWSKIMREAHGKLVAIAVPSGVAGDYSKLVGAFEQQAAAMERVAAAAATGSVPAVRRAMAASDAANERRKAIAGRIGLAECATD